MKINELCCVSPYLSQFGRLPAYIVKVTSYIQVIFILPSAKRYLLREFLILRNALCSNSVVYLLYDKGVCPCSYHFSNLPFNRKTHIIEYGWQVLFCSHNKTFIQEAIQMIF